MRVLVAIQAMSSIFVESGATGGGREKGAPERRVVCFKRSANGKNVHKMMLFEGQHLVVLSVQGSAESIIDMTIGLLLDPICHEGV